MGVIPTGWFISKNAIEMDDLEVLPSMEKKHVKNRPSLGVFKALLRKTQLEQGTNCPHSRQRIHGLALAQLVLGK